MVLRKMIENLLQFLTKIVFGIITFLLTFKTMILDQRPFRNIYDTLSLTNSTVLTADNILWCTKNPVLR